MDLLVERDFQVYKITWDKEINGVLLHSRIVADVLGFSPRPVFFEELDLLGLNKLGWKYPHCEEPLLWAINKQYYYKGELVFEAKGANIYDAAIVVFQPAGEHLELEPIDVETMLYRNKDMMFLLESEAIEFIHETYEQYARARKTIQAASANTLDFEALAQKAEKKTKKKMAIVKEDCDSFDIMPLEDANNAGKRVYQTTKIDKFIASFSGGKDSQVVLDLCTRAIPSTDFEVIYSDTGYELPPSLELYDKIQKQYKEKFPDLKFSLARNHDSVLNYWDKIGTPSDKHRWCCAIMKTAPLYRTMKGKDNKQLKVLAFEGVRAEESVMRSSYERIGRGVKHSTVINARPILRWNTTEIFLYLFKYGHYINEAYRLGKPRVGCVICPFSSPWDDMIVNRKYHAKLSPFLDRLISMAKQRKIPNLDEYIKDRKWKLRASGRTLENRNTKVMFKSLAPKFSAHVINGHYQIMDWLPVLGTFNIVKEKAKVKGELKIKDKIYKFNIDYTDNNDYTFNVPNVTDSQLIPLLKRVVYKSAYCINCEGCEVECPTGALSVYPRLNVDRDKCVHCHKCLTFHDNGCIVANSLISNMEDKGKLGSISKYGTFGIHEEWVEEFLDDPEAFWTSNTLGNKQVDSFKAWLKDSEIIDSKCKLTDFGEFCSEVYIDQSDLIWELIWVNLVHNNALIDWFVNAIKVNQTFAKPLLDELSIEYFGSSFSRSSVVYAMGALLQVFKYSPIGEDMEQGVPQGKNNYQRLTYDNISDIAIAYSLYKYSKLNGTKALRVADFYNESCRKGPYKEFGIGKELFFKKLRNLNSAKERLLIAELNMGLDSITLRDDIDCLDVLKRLM
jgi:phosphoadenosine phosphosulfate reductase